MTTTVGQLRTMLADFPPDLEITSRNDDGQYDEVCGVSCITLHDQNKMQLKLVTKQEAKSMVFGLGRSAELAEQGAEEVQDGD